jgi:hypothetical protein
MESTQMKDLIIPVFTKFFKTHFDLDVMVEPVPAISPVFMVCAYIGGVKKHLLIVYVSERKGTLPILNVYSYEDPYYLNETIKKAKQATTHFSNIMNIFENINKRINLFQFIKKAEENKVVTNLEFEKVNSSSELMNAYRGFVAHLRSPIGHIFFYPRFKFTIYENELYLDLRISFDFAHVEKVFSSHPQLFVNVPDNYINIEKEIYSICKKEISAKLRNSLKIIITPDELKSMSDTEWARYVTLLGMTSI